MGEHFKPAASYATLLRTQTDLLKVYDSLKYVTAGAKARDMLADVMDEISRQLDTLSRSGD